MTRPSTPNVLREGGFRRYRRALTVYLGVNMLIAGLCLYGIVASPRAR